jgi:Tol biopolymer transport system component/tRNA A-37 threonylcarbamoyl transferase component Bud32
MKEAGISHYEIVEKIGEGGMGCVYKARDLHLDRTVAIKVLRDDKVADPRRQRRFVQEAKAASALNHPNIVTIYDIDEAGGVHFIAMEYVSGRTMGEMIGRNGLPVPEALQYAVQVADALAAAHRAGIVHRDLKPANVMVAEAGLVKVLDFGLAKLRERGDAPRPAPGTTETLTGNAPDTEEGAILGTAAYMSPEQVDGKTADARSDIFSFGAVLYEMITGRRAFQGSSTVSTMAAILNKEPAPLRELAAEAPRELERAIVRCLRKDPGRRFQLMDDLKLTLEELKEESDSGAAPMKARARVGDRKKRWVLAGALIVIAAAVLFAARFFQRPSGRLPAQFQLIQLTKDPGVSLSPALSADGKLVAYASDRSDKENLDLWLQQVDGGGAIRLTRHPATDHSPNFSPDGTRIVFCSERDGGGIYVMPALGGDSDARLVATRGRSPRFSPDGRAIVYHAGVRGGFEGSGIYTVSVDGGPAVRLQPELIARASAPVWTPDGNHLMFFGVHSKEGWDLWVTALSGGVPVRTGVRAALNRQGIRIAGLDALSARGDYLLFSGVLGDSTNLWRVPVSPRTWQVSGAAERLTAGAAEFSASLASGGRLAFFSGARAIRLWILPADASRGVARGRPEPLTGSGAHDTGCDISADGKTVAFRSNRSGSFDIWLKDLRSGKELALTSTPAFESMPKISRDGLRVAYSLFENERRALYVLPAAGGLPQRVCEDCGPPASWSPDGGSIVYVRMAQPHSEIHMLELATGRSRPLLQHPQLPLYGGKFSPNGEWIAFKGDLDQRRTVIFVAPVRGGVAASVENWVEVSEGRDWDDLPRWSPAGSLLYFTSDRDGFRCIWARRLDPRTMRPQGESFAVQHLHEMQVSMNTLSLAEFELGAAPGKLVFPMAELKGNIWLMEPRAAQRR